MFLEFYHFYSWLAHIWPPTASLFLTQSMFTQYRPPNSCRFQRDPQNLNLHFLLIWCSSIAYTKCRSNLPVSRMTNRNSTTRLCTLPQLNSSINKCSIISSFVSLSLCSLSRLRANTSAQVAVKEPIFDVRLIFHFRGGNDKMLLVLGYLQVVNFIFGTSGCFTKCFNACQKFACFAPWDYKKNNLLNL